MLSIAGQTAGPIGLKFFVDTQGWPGGVRLKNKKKNFFHFFIYGQRRAPQLVITNFETRFHPLNKDFM